MREMDWLYFVNVEMSGMMEIRKESGRLIISIRRVIPSHSHPFPSLSFYSLPFHFLPNHSLWTILFFPIFLFHSLFYLLHLNPIPFHHLMPFLIHDTPLIPISFTSSSCSLSKDFDTILYSHSFFIVTDTVLLFCSNGSFLFVPKGTKSQVLDVWTDFLLSIWCQYVFLL